MFYFKTRTFHSKKPYLLLPHLNGQRYLRFTRCAARVVGEGTSCCPWEDVAATSHFHVEVCRHLDHTFPNRWIGRGGPVPWPPRSSDLTPLDFFLGTVEVYETSVDTDEELFGRVLAANLIVLQTLGIFERVRQNFCAGDWLHWDYWSQLGTVAVISNVLLLFSYVAVMSCYKLYVVFCNK